MAEHLGGGLVHDDAEFLPHGRWQLDFVENVRRQFQRRAEHV